MEGEPAPSSLEERPLTDTQRLTDRMEGARQLADGAIHILQQIRLLQRREPEARELGRLRNQIRGVRDRMSRTLDPRTAQTDLQALQQALTEARTRFGVDAAQYHRRITLQPGEREDPERHFMRMNLKPGRRRLVLVFCGNGESLSQETPTGPLRGGTHLYDGLSTPDAPAHVVQLRVGNALSTSPGSRNEVAAVHIENIVDDILEQHGAFAGLEVSDISVFGYSYGAGMAQRIIQRIEARRSSGRPTPPVERTAFLDGIEFQSVPPRAIRRRPVTATASSRHFHAWQGSNRRIRTTIEGASLQDTRAGDVSRQVASTTHSEVNDAARQPDLFRDIRAHLLS